MTKGVSFHTTFPGCLHPQGCFGGCRGVGGSPIQPQQRQLWLATELTGRRTGLFTLGWASLIAQLVMNPPAMQETPVQFLGWEDALENG